jgi:hypothetical protein
VQVFGALDSNDQLKSSQLYYVPSTELPRPCHGLQKPTSHVAGWFAYQQQVFIQDEAEVRVNIWSMLI